MINIAPIVEGVLLTQLNEINVLGGNVLHGMKASDKGFFGFGEAYFSIIKPGAIKAWKRHREMTLNLIVPLGAIRFVIYDDRKSSASNGVFQEVILSRKNYCRLTIPPMLWTGFQCVDENKSFLLNIANIEHFYEESDKKKLNEIKYEWR